MKAMFEKYLSMPNDSREKTLFVAVSLCLVCSILVSAAAVALRPLQEANKELDKRRNILQIGGLMEPGKSVEELFSQIDARVIDIDSGEFTDAVSAETYDQRVAAKDPAMSEALDKATDIASIKRRAKYASVYLVKEGDVLKRVILPVHGSGLWSTLYGFVALESDMRTVSGFGFYQHGETPGLGGEVDNPKWKALWPGKQLYNDAGEVSIAVVKGNVDTSRPEAVHQVDGLAGATLTSNGVQNLVRFWMGENGYAKFLNNLRENKG